MGRFDKLHSNQKILILELLKRGVQVDIIDETREIVRAVYQGHVEYLYDRDSSIVPYNLSIIAGNKALTKQILRDNKISVPRGMSYPLGNPDIIIQAFKIIGKPVTLKPVFGSHGFDVYLDLQDTSQVEYALCKLQEKYSDDKEILIEEYFPAKEYRVFITKEKKYAVLEREPASVIGDGTHTIHELILIENHRRMNPREKAWCEIMEDDALINYINNQGYQLSDIIPKGNKLFVRPNSNVATGGLPINRTDITHPTAIDICMQVLDAFQGLPYIGIDFMTEDISKPQNKDTYRIIEINTIPGVDMHYRPAIGKSENIASYMVDLIFPETKYLATYNN